jgi:NAD(P)-dependent dehydrogenase (short-subunit alcohol dehydrogenase family)
MNWHECQRAIAAAADCRVEATMKKFSDKSVLITGASRGLGRALLTSFAQAGARVMGVARGTEELDRVTGALAAHGLDVHGLSADLGDVRAIYPLVGAAQALVGPIDVLIHNASTLGPTPLGPLLDTECEDFARVLDVNLLGPFRLTKAIVGGMLVRGRGLVVSISSDAAVSAYPDWGAYGVSKAALDHLSRSWAAELAGTGVIAVSLDPGEMDTAMHRAALPHADPATLARPDVVAAAVMRWIGDLTPADSGSRVVIADWGRS